MNKYIDTITPERFESIATALRSAMSSEYRDGSLECRIWDDLNWEFFNYTLPDYGPVEQDEDECGERAAELLDSTDTMIYTSRLVDEWTRRDMPEPEYCASDASITYRIYTAVWKDVDPHSVGYYWAETINAAIESLPED